MERTPSNSEITQKVSKSTGNIPELEASGGREFGVEGKMRVQREGSGGDVGSAGVEGMRVSDGGVGGECVGGVRVRSVRGAGLLSESKEGRLGFDTKGRCYYFCKSNVIAFALIFGALASINVELDTATNNVEVFVHLGSACVVTLALAGVGQAVAGYTILGAVSDANVAAFIQANK
eukprot:1394252-Amorphochlora_amoeboformis.AAC.1